jgi:hypothetical protein
MDVSQLFAIYLAGPRLLRDAVAGLTREQLLARPVPGKWSTLEVVSHIADFEIVYGERIKAVLACPGAPLPVRDEELYVKKLACHERGVEEELNLIEIMRRHVARILQNVSASELQLTGMHSEAGPLSVETLLKRVTKHIPHHVEFITEKRRAMGIG